MNDERMEQTPLLGPVDEKTVTLIGDEAKAMDHLLKAAGIIFDWKPKGNYEELGTAIHVMQGFIIQHMLHRLNPRHWNSWYEEQHACAACGHEHKGEGACGAALMVEDAEEDIPPFFLECRCDGESGPMLTGVGPMADVYEVRRG